MAKGWIYVMSNPAFSYLKIGQSSKDPQSRASELSSSTGVPMPFTLEYCALVEEFESVERAVHDRLSSCRVNDNREFFDCSIEEAVGTIKTMAEKMYFDEQTLGKVAQSQSQSKTWQMRPSTASMHRTSSSSTTDINWSDAEYLKYFSSSRGKPRQPGLYRLCCPVCAQNIRVQMSTFFENHSITCNCRHCDWIGSVDGRDLEIFTDYQG